MKIWDSVYIQVPAGLICQTNINKVDLLLMGLEINKVIFSQNDIQQKLKN